MPKTDEEQIGNKTKKRSFLKKLGWVGIMLILILVINVAGASAWGIEEYADNNPEFCATCHNMESHVSSYLENPEHLSYVHMEANVGCKDCHSDYSIVDQAKSLGQFLVGDYDEVMSRRRVDDDMCLQCHISLEFQEDETDYLERNPHKSHWENLKCVSCHLSHDKQVDYCSRCHDNGGQRMTGDIPIPRAINPWAEE